MIRYSLSLYAGFRCFIDDRNINRDGAIHNMKYENVLWRHRGEVCEENSVNLEQFGVKRSTYYILFDLKRSYV